MYSMTLNINGTLDCTADQAVSVLIFTLSVTVRLRMFFISRSLEDGSWRVPTACWLALLSAERCESHVASLILTVTSSHLYRETHK